MLQIIHFIEGLLVGMELKNGRLADNPIDREPRVYMRTNTWTRD